MGKLGAALLVLAVAGCSSEARREPKSEARAHDAAVRAVAIDADMLPHRTFPDLAAALTALIGDDVEVVGFGELHQRVDRATTARSALARFTDEALPALAARTSDLVIETWQFDPGCGKQAKKATAKVETTMQRPESTKSELATLVERARAARIQPHAMKLSCDDWNTIAPPDKDIDYEAMLSIITRELGRIAILSVGQRKREQATRRLVLTYGGAMHNDLYPILEEWSFAARVDDRTAQRYLEIDLYVPEYAEIDKLVQTEPWFPLVARTARDAVIVIERGPRSYVVLLQRS